MTESCIQVEASATFRRNLRTLAKKYRSIRDDVQPIIEQLEQGELPGDRIAAVGYEVFKLRIRNSDMWWRSPNSSAGSLNSKRQSPNHKAKERDLFAC